MDWIDACEERTAYVTASLATEAPPPPSWAALFPWQRTTLLWMAAQEERRTVTVNSVTVTAAAPGGLVASAVGTGKTAVLVTHLLERATAARPALVVVPAQVEQQWADEFERVGAAAGTPVAVLTKPAKQRRGAPPEQRFVVWRCTTVRQSRTPPPGWRVLLITYSFVALRFSAMQGGHWALDIPAWVAAAPAYAAEHGLETCLHDRTWGWMVYDEVCEAHTQLPRWQQELLEAVPAEHVWGVSSTPVDLAAVCRTLRLSASREDAVRAALRREPWQPGALLAWALRYSKAVMAHVRVRAHVADLQLGATERQVLEFMELSGAMGSFRRRALVCTDVAALMAELTRGDPEDTSQNAEPQYARVTRDAFWAAMLRATEAKRAATAQKLQAARARVQELAMVSQALPGDGGVLRQLAEAQGAEARLAREAGHIQQQAQYIEGLERRVAEAEANPCPICMDAIPAGGVAVTPCAHVFCDGCLLPWVRSHGRCPMCRADVREAAVQVIVAAGEAEGGAVVSSEGAGGTGAEGDREAGGDTGAREYSTKIRYLLTQLRVLFASTDDKAIVFCDYPGTVRTIQGVLTAEGIACTDLVGNVYCKNSKLRAFRADPAVRVMFLHTGTHHTGMDLFCANHVFFVNAVQSPDVVQQAVGRCVRLSQTKDVHVTFLVVPQVETPPDLAATLGPFYVAPVDSWEPPVGDVEPMDLIDASV
jgi:hypothetical protein